MYFIDSEQNKPREIDVVATIRQQGVNTRFGKVLVEVSCVCDVKSTSAATVVLSSPPAGPERWSDLKGFAAHSVEILKDGKKQEETHFVSARNIIGLTTFSKRIGRVALRINSKTSAQDKNRVSDQATKESMFSAGKAAEYFLAKRKRYVDFDFEFGIIKERYLFYFSLPMVIVDGPLYEYYYEDGKDFLVDSQFVPVRFSRARTQSVDEGQDKSPGGPRIVVDSDIIMFCHIDYVEHFIGRLSKWVSIYSVKNLEKTIERIAKSKDFNDDIPF